MGKKLDLTGQVFGRLTVVKEAEAYINLKGKKYTKWLCKCSCGNIKEVMTTNLKTDHTTSCGCYFKETLIERLSSHKSTQTKEYKIWKNFKQRCLNSKNKAYEDYGGRGITICDKWINSFEAFLKDVGKCPGPEYSLDRIDNNGNYCKENVRWTNSTVQNINQRIKSNNTSGVKGVLYNKKANKWEARITVRKRRIYLGIFSTKEEAIAKRLEAEEIHHKPLL